MRTGRVQWRPPYWLWDDCAPIEAALDAGSQVGVIARLDDMELHELSLTRGLNEQNDTEPARAHPGLSVRS
jgi:hypothetical protein